MQDTDKAIADCIDKRYRSVSRGDGTHYNGTTQNYETVELVTFRQFVHSVSEKIHLDPSIRVFWIRNSYSKDLPSSIVA